ncbi:MAG: hypothetical protein SPI18_02055, partial [Prevotella sp.]|nr:hypothetical protein [Prevotella sp.]
YGKITDHKIQEDMTALTAREHSILLSNKAVQATFDKFGLTDTLASDELKSCGWREESPPQDFSISRRFSRFCSSQYPCGRIRLYRQNHLYWYSLNHKRS